MACVDSLKVCPGTQGLKAAPQTLKRWASPPLPLPPAAPAAPWVEGGSSAKRRYGKNGGGLIGLPGTRISQVLGREGSLDRGLSLIAVVGLSPSPFPIPLTLGGCSGREVDGSTYWDDLMGLVWDQKLGMTMAGDSLLFDTYSRFVRYQV